jgi:DNA-binding response OmpR family regulator
MQPGDVLQGRRILVVEDDPLIALDIQEILTAAGVTVIGPTSRLAHALRLVESREIDAAVLDVRLEVGTTLPLAERLAERGVPFLFQTSDPGVLGGQYQGAPVLVKPFRPDGLIAALEILLAKRERMS